jgi:hypothetical protein
MTGQSIVFLIPEVPFFTTLIFIVISYARVPAASCASETSADSKLRL